MVVFVIKGNRRLYDFQTIKQILNVSRSKVQRELKKQNTEIVKYKNLYLYDETTLLNLMELILIEKLGKSNDRLE
jgi:hypothetical protein